MSQSTPNRRRVRRVPAYWPDQESAIESGTEGTPAPVEQEAAAVPVEVAAAQPSEPEAQVEPTSQIPTRRARTTGAAQADEAGTAVSSAPALPPLKKKGAKTPSKQAATEDFYEPIPPPKSSGAAGRGAPPPARSSSMLGPIAIGIGSGAVLGLVIILILIITRNNNHNTQSTNPPVANAPTSVQSSGNGATDNTGSAPQAVPTNVAAADTPTVPVISAAELSATPSGIFDTGPANAARGRFNLPRGIALDSKGEYYVADSQNERIEKFDPTGKFLLAFGSMGTDQGQFSPMAPDAVGTGPSGLATDSAGNIYVADTWNHRIQKFDSTGKFVSTWGGFITLNDPDSAKDPDLNSKFWGPRGVAVGPDGNVYITDTGNKRVLIFDGNGKYLRKIDSGMDKEKVDANYAFNKPGELNEPIGVAVDSASNVYVADTRNNRIQKFGKDGKPVAQWAVPTTAWAPGPYLEPYLALDSKGDVYATAPTGKSVLEFGPDGKMLGEKTKQGSVTLQTPTGIAVASDGTIYVVDTGANAVINFGKMP